MGGKRRSEEKRFRLWEEGFSGRVRVCKGVERRSGRGDLTRGEGEGVGGGGGRGGGRGAGRRLRGGGRGKGRHYGGFGRLGSFGGSFRGGGLLAGATVEEGSVAR